MSLTESEFWERATQARDQLAGLLLDRPEVSLIDIGFDPQNRGSEKRPVLRVHVRRSEDRERLDIPIDMDGIPVIVIIADYKLEL